VDRIDFCKPHNSLVALQHSGSYSDERAIDALVAWVVESDSAASGSASLGTEASSG
jgi:hypothetical protein